MATKNIEIQDSTGNIYYPHTDASIVKFGDSNVNATLSDMVYQAASGSATAITLTIKGTLVTGYPITFIASANNGGATTTINGKKLYKPGTTTSPNLIAGKAYNVWYNSISDCFFIKASAEGDADVSNVLATKKFSNDNDTGLVGTMPNNGAVSSILTNSNQEYIIPAGFHNGLGKIKVIVNNLAAEAIKAGTTVGGIIGTFTSDATATAIDIANGKTAYVNGNKITGTGGGYSPGSTVLSGKIDLKFNQKWKSADYAYYNSGNYMCSDGNYSYGFFTQSSASGDYIAKFDLNGNLIWRKTVGYYGVTMCNDDSGNLYVAYLNLVVIKYDANGVQKWSFSNNYYDSTEAMIYVNGCLILTQNTGILKFNTADGSTSSVAANPSNTSVKCHALAAGKDGYFYASMSNGDIVKFDTSFNRIWTIHPSTSSNRVSLFVDNSNNLCIFITDSKAYKYDSNGNKIWEQSMGDGDLKFVDKNNYWYVLGNHKTSITQFNPNGEKTWMFNDSMSDGYMPATMYVDNDLNVYYMVDSVCKMRPEYTIVS
ncbi:hypothetical protein BCD91_002449 [Clostridium beijerinckii]|uniref:hypothetical protein n=1 Tax=Clostridium beijerinckii TaxID=1520 RepID=UPI001F4C3956|nr:hypothetical protein [Clostridium beijerinckii]NOW90426.1 hypothetical protein [Clostridium beijerinckii]